MSEAEARTQRYTRRAQSAYQRLNRSIQGLTRGFLGFVAVLGAGHILQSTDQLLKLSQATDLTFEQFQRLAFAFEQAGINNVQLSRGLVRLSQAMDELRTGSGAGADALARLGISLSDVENLSQQDRLFLILERLRGIEDAGTRAALATDLFGGRLATLLGPILAATNADLTALGDSFGGVITEQDARNIEVFNDTMNELRLSVVRLVTTFSPFLNVVSGLLNGIIRLIDAIPGLNLLLGAGLAAIVGVRLVQAFSSAAATVGSLSARFIQFGYAGSVASAQANGLALRVARLSHITGGGARSIAFFRGALIGLGAVSRIASGAMRALGAAFRFALGPIGLIIIAIETVIFLFGDQLVAVFRSAANFIIRQMNNLIDGLNALLEFFGLDGIDVRFEEWASSVDTAADALPPLIDNVDDLGGSLGNVEPMLNSFEQQLESLSDTASRVADTTTNVFNGIADGIADALTGASFSIRDFVRSAIRDFIALQARTALFNIAAGAGIGSLFPAPRQFGGPVNAGSPYIVGEAGPELFVPQQTGQIVPNDSLAGGNVTLNINAVDARSFQQLAASDPSFIFNLAERGRRAAGR